jgi:hypothetical protein
MDSSSIFQLHVSDVQTFVCLSFFICFNTTAEVYYFAAGYVFLVFRLILVTKSFMFNIMTFSPLSNLRSLIIKFFATNGMVQFV